MPGKASEGEILGKWLTLSRGTLRLNKAQWVFSAFVHREGSGLSKPDCPGLRAEWEGRQWRRKQLVWEREKEGESNSHIDILNIQSKYF